MTTEKMREIITEYIIENQVRFYRFAYSYVREKEAALDIVQNAVCKAMEKYTDIREADKINSWFYKVLLNEIYSFFNKNKREFPISDEMFPEKTYNEKAFEKDDSLYNSINLLPEELKTVILLRYFEDLPLKDISVITKTNLNTVKTRLYSALKRLRKIYEKEDGI